MLRYRLGDVALTSHASSPTPWHQWRQPTVHPQSLWLHLRVRVRDTLRPRHQRVWILNPSHGSGFGCGVSLFCHHCRTCHPWSVDQRLGYRCYGVDDASRTFWTRCRCTSHSRARKGRAGRRLVGRKWAMAVGSGGTG